MNSKIIAIDFDDTCVISNFPDIIADNLMAIETLKDLVSNGHRLLLFTCRDNTSEHLPENGTGAKNGITPGNYLTEAIKWFHKNNIELYGIQTNPENQNSKNYWKPFYDYIIDDKALGIPTLKLKITKDKTIKYVDWLVVRELLREKNLIK